MDNLIFNIKLLKISLMKESTLSNLVLSMIVAPGGPTHMNNFTTQHKKED